MKSNRTAARWFAGLLVVGTVAAGGVAAPAQAKDTGWNGTVAPADTKPVNTKPSFRDTGWNGT